MNRSNCNRMKEIMFFDEIKQIAVSKVNANHSTYHQPIGLMQSVQIYLSSDFLIGERVFFPEKYTVSFQISTPTVSSKCHRTKAITAIERSR